MNRILGFGAHITALAVLVVCCGTASAASKPCPKVGKRDFICGSGDVQVTTGEETRRAGKRPARLIPYSQVSVAPEALADVNFGRRATCQFGDLVDQTAFISRRNPDESGLAALFSQTMGYAICTFAARRGTAAANYVCEADNVCRARVELDGFSQFYGGPESTETLPDGTVVTTTRLDFCAGRFNVSYPGGFVGGGAGDRSRVRVVIEHRILVTPNGTAESTSGSAVAVSGDGACESRVFRRQRQLVDG